MPFPFDMDLFWPIAGALGAGGLIGAEREYRGHPAGFRTHILVSLSAALLMLAALHQVRWLTDTPAEMIRIDPARMAHGILTGIGFLCGGVIFREGFTIHGLTTAASLWTTASLGILFGIGFYGLAVGGTLATLFVLAALSLMEALLPQRRLAEIRVRYRADANPTLAAFREMLARHGLDAEEVRIAREGDFVELETNVYGVDREKAERLASALSADPTVSAFACTSGKA